MSSQGYSGVEGVTGALTNALGIPGGLLTTFQAQKESVPERRPGSTGWRSAFDTVGTVEAVLAQSTFNQLMLSTQLDYNITHQLIHEGTPVLASGDRFRKPPDPLAGTPERLFWVRKVEDPGELHLYAVYSVEERSPT